MQQGWSVHERSYGGIEVLENGKLSVEEWANELKEHTSWYGRKGMEEVGAPHYNGGRPHGFVGERWTGIDVRKSICCHSPPGRV